VEKPCKGDSRGSGVLLFRQFDDSLNDFVIRAVGVQLFRELVGFRASGFCFWGDLIKE
jgi:hypothetical protein